MTRWLYSERPTRYLCLCAQSAADVTAIVAIAVAATPADAQFTFTPVSSMTTARADHTATLLRTGQVLITGGVGKGFQPLASAELYDPATAEFTSAGNMTTFRSGHTATLLDDGKVLIAGGAQNLSAEIYDPSTGTFTATGNMLSSGGPATLLPNGRVLVAGATNAEVYDPATGTFTLSGAYADPSPLWVNTATLLLDGRVLITGCASQCTAGATELYDPQSDTLSRTGPMRGWENVNTATLLMDGTVLFVGNSENDGFAADAEVYRPATGGFTFIGLTIAPHEFSAAVRLSDGTVLITGGQLPGGNGSAGSDLYLPATGTFLFAGNMVTGRHEHTATLLPDGTVLIAGGFSIWPAPTSTAEIFSPSPLLAAVLPTSRSVQVGTPATAFATIINTGTSTATGCQITPGTTLPAGFAFQTTNPATNAVTGTVNTPVDIPAHAAQSFVFAFTPTAAIAPTDVRLNFVCANAAAAPVVAGLNTLLFSASTTPVPDIVAMSATLKNDGIVNIPGTTGTGIFSVAAMNLGAGATITVSVDMGAANLPVRIALCQTDPVTGQCVNPTVPTTSPVVTTINANETPTFGIFVTGTSSVPFAPATSRIFVRFKDAGAVTRGSTSVAVRTQ